MSESDNEELRQLLNKWNCSQIFEELKNENITVKRLQFLTEADLDSIFRSRKLGDKAEFRFHLTEWRKAKGYKNVQTCDTSSLSPETLRFIEQCRRMCAEESVSNIKFNDSQEKSTPTTAIDVTLALRSHSTGEYVTRYFVENNKLNDTARKILIDAIVNWCMINKYKLSRNSFEDIALQIQQRFNDNKLIYYDCSGPRANGKLYDKYNNTLRRIKKTSEIENFQQLDSDILLTSTSSNTDALKHSTAEIQKACDWLKIFNEPWSDVQSNWRKTFEIRRRDILMTNQNDNTVIDVLNNWKTFTLSLGYNLIDIDFSIIHPAASCLMEKWNHFMTKIIPILNEKVKDPQSLDLLQKVNAKDKGSELLIALLLHVLLRPNIKRKNDDSKSKYKATIKDSQQSFLLHVVTVNDVYNQLEQMKTALYHRGETLQPLIIAIGISLSEAKFYVYFDEIKYELHSFLTSLDVCFKVFNVLNLKYPGDSIEFWTFVQKYFYSLDFKEDKVSPDVLCLINDLK